VKRLGPKKDLKQALGEGLTQLGAGNQVGWARTQAEFVVLQAGLEIPEQQVFIAGAIAI